MPRLKVDRLQLYTMVCSGCGCSCYTQSNVAHTDKSQAYDYALEAGWKEIGGAVYCQGCVRYDADTDSYIITNTHTDEL